MADRAPRLVVVQLVLMLALAVIVGRAFQVQLLQGEELRRRAEASRTEHVVLPARRGAIYDRHQVPLATTLERYHVGVAPQEIGNRRRTVADVSGALALAPHEVERRLQRTRWAYFHGPYSAAQVETLRDARGVYLEPVLTRFYPSRSLVRPLVGRPAQDGRPATGLERQLDSLLRGTPGAAVVLKDPMGRAYESPSRLLMRPVAGMDVYLTLDAELQEIARQSLQTALRETGASEGTVVALEPRTGDVLAMVTVTARGADKAGAILDAYEPGSIAKLFAAATLYELDRIRAGERVSGERGRWNLGFRVITDVEPRPTFTLEEAVTYSSNIAMSKFVDRLAPEEQFLGLRAFGFGVPTGIEIPGEAAGVLPRPHDWSRPTPQSLAMGYEFSATALQIAAAYAAIAHDGLLMQPHLIAEIRAPDQQIVYRRVPTVVRRAVSSDVAARLRRLLEGAVTMGTGSEAALTQFTIGGKTGTARRVVNGSYAPGAYNATFISLFPAEEPQLSVVVTLRDPQGEYHAGETAAPVVRALIEQTLTTDDGVIDRTRLARAAPQAEVERPLVQGEATFVVKWPDTAETTAVPSDRAIPNVEGLALRSAVRVLHQRGFRVRIRGWGAVASVRPAVGSMMPPGTVVTLIAEER